MFLEKVIEIFPIIAGGFQADVKGGDVVGLAKALQDGEQELITGGIFSDDEWFEHELLVFIDNDNVMFELADIDADEERMRHDEALLDLSDERPLRDYCPLCS